MIYSETKRIIILGSLQRSLILIAVMMNTIGIVITVNTLILNKQFCDINQSVDFNTN